VPHPAHAYARDSYGGGKDRAAEQSCVLTWPSLSLRRSGLGQENTRPV
jgi:hypothetical protein